MKRALHLSVALLALLAPLAAVSNDAAKAPDTYDIHLLLTDGTGPLAGVTVLATSEGVTDKTVSGPDGGVILAVAGEIVQLYVDTAGGIHSKVKIQPGVTDWSGTLRVSGGSPEALIEAHELETFSDMEEIAGPYPGFEYDQLLAAQMPDSFEPDDTRAECGSIPDDGTPQERTIAPAGDEDWVCVTAQCGDILIFETSPGAGGDDVDTVIELYDPYDVQVAVNDDGGAGLYSLLEYTVTETGDYALKVRGFGGTSTGDYALTFNRDFGGTPLVLEVTDTPVPDGIDYHAEALTPAPLGYDMATGTNPMIDISGTGTPLSLGDDDYEAVSLPFSFEFFDDAKTSLLVGSNGYLTFGTDGSDLSNDCIPNTTDPNDYVAAFWDDLDPGNSGSPAGVYYETQGTSPDQMFIVMWDQVPAYPNNGSHTFEIILYESTNEVEIRYGPLYGDSDSDGGSATSGIENAAGDFGVQFSCNTAGNILEGVSVLFSPQPPSFIPYPVTQSYSYVQDSVAMNDISTTGTALGLGDDDWDLVPLPFSFKFYGDWKNDIRISSNGYVTFGTDGTDLSNDCIPNTTDPDDYIAGFWDDLDPGNSGSPAEVYYETQGTSPDQVFIVMWDQVPAFPNNGSHNFQILLYETSNDIELRYGVLTGDSDSDGRSATAGIENRDGTAGLEISCNTAGNLYQGVSYYITATDNVPEYMWWDPVSGTVFTNTQDYHWTDADGCDVEVQVTVVDPTTECTLVASETVYPCGGGGGDWCDSLPECQEYCESLATNHGSYVSCMARATQSLWKRGIITLEERQQAQRDAAHSDIGK